VQFYADGALTGSPVALSNGAATWLTDMLAVGTHVITATYSGDNNFMASSAALSGDRSVSDTTITGLAAINSSPTRVTAATYFTATISAGSNVTYQWDFDDGQTGGGPMSSHIYTATDLYRYGHSDERIGIIPCDYPRHHRTHEILFASVLRF